MAEYARFRGKQGRDPSTTATDPAEKLIAYWVADQRRKTGQGQLLPRHEALLDETNPHWRNQNGQSLDGAFATRLAEYARFRAEHGRDPSGNAADRAEKLIGRWISKQRGKSRQGCLSCRRIDLLDQTNPYWRDQNGRTADDKFATRLAEYARFRSEHGRDPSRKSPDQHERYLGHWIVSQRTARTRGSMAPERAAAFDAVSQSWREPSGRRTSADTARAA